MEGMEEKLGAILGNPQLMQQIMAMSQALGQSQEKAPEPKQPEPPPIDPAMLQKLGSLAGKSSIDSNEQALLKALGPYLSRTKVSKLEKAMRAAKMARLASTFLGSGGLQLLTGR